MFPSLPGTDRFPKSQNSESSALAPHKESKSSHEGNPNGLGIDPDGSTLRKPGQGFRCLPGLGFPSKLGLEQPGIVG